MLVAFASASCPNDCSQHGLCNQYSACECYRNWMGADCSERVCPFGHAFIDTPQGDLNADGRVDRSDVFLVTIESDATFSTSVTFPANVLLFASTATGTSNILESVGATLASASSSANDAGDHQWKVPVVVHDGAKPTGLTGIQCGLITDGDDGDIRACGTLNALSTAFSGSTAFDIIEVESGTYTYNTQFTNKNTWELYPMNHGKGKEPTTLTKYWDEAHFYSECSGKGICNRGSGECDCFPGFTGAGCARTSCPNDCSGHGVCSRLTDVSSTYAAWDRNKTQYCVCDAGYDGIDCSQRKCPSGDDPITRAVDVSSSSDQSFVYVNSPHVNGQEPEIQTFGRFFAASAGYFALEFKDEFGDKWVTQTMGWGASAEEVESALEALPNSVIQDCSVHAYTDTSGVVVHDASGTGSIDFKSWTITFISNSGDIDPLGVRYSITSNIGMTDLKTETDNNGEFRTLMVDLNGGLTFGVNGVDDNTLAQAIGVCSFHTCAATGAEAQTEPTVGADDDHNLSINPDGSADNQIVFHTTGRQGSQENAVCSNRGLCDYSSGLCKCFNGFTDDDCSRQNALAMY
jgi:hypothetical protein